jgi:arylsulfatase A-like enzyme
MAKFRGLARREFLKLISLAPVGIYSRPLLKLAKTANDDNMKNIIIIVFDAWSQRDVSLYGYPRRTMPNLEAFAEKATIYHNHFSTGTFTSPSTSTLLSGLYPWSHRVFQLGAGVAPAHAGHTIFSALSSTHSTLAYTQNKFADQLLYQSEGNLDNHVRNWSFNIQNTNLYGAPIFKKDARLAFASFQDNILTKSQGFASSLFFDPLYQLGYMYDRLREKEKYASKYPHGVPGVDEAFILPDVVDGAISLLKEIQQPSLAYLHFYPPHEPYTPTAQFFDSFINDGWRAPDKPMHDLAAKKDLPEKLQQSRRYYDEFISSWDNEVARLFQFLKDSKLTDNSYIIVTADHGEFFERGESGHWTKMIYDPLIHIPLIVMSPGQESREDVHTITSSVDLLPTVAHLTGHPIPDWVEGKLLPKLGGDVDEGRSVFSMDAKFNSAFGPLVNYAISLTRDRHRLIHYSYRRDNYDKYEFYDLDSDPEEMKDWYPSHPSLAKEMQDELSQKVEEVNKPFQRDGL